MKQSIFSNWNFIRSFRLVIGCAILIQVIIAKDILFGLAGLLFTCMAVFNVGCCGNGGCTALVKNNMELKKISTYEEVV